MAWFNPLRAGDLARWEKAKGEALASPFSGNVRSFGPTGSTQPPVQPDPGRQACVASGFFQLRFGGLTTRPFLMALAATRM